MSKRLSFKSDFSRFLNDPTFPYKVTVCIGDERILCSGALLAQQSSVLEKKFREDDGILLFDEFLDTEKIGEPLKDCLRFLHGADLSFSEDNFEVILKFASFYKVKDLFAATFSWMKRTLKDISGVSGVVIILKYLKISRFLQSADSKKLKNCVFSYLQSSGHNLTIESEDGYKHDVIYPYLVDLSGYDVSELIKNEPFDSTFLVDWVSLSSANKKFLLDHPALFYLENVFRDENDFSKFMTIFSEDESFISQFHIGQLLKIQRDYFLTKNASVSGETSHNTSVPEKTSPKHRNGQSSRGKAENFVPLTHRSRFVSGSKKVKNVIPTFTNLQLEPKACNSGVNQNCYSSSNSKKSAAHTLNSYWEMLQGFDYSSSVWVGNLPEAINRGEIINVFGKFGAVVSVTIRDNPSGYEKYAFIEFGNKSIAQNLLLNAKYNQFQIRGHRLKIAARRKIL